MRKILGTLVLAFLAVIALPAAADAYTYHCQVDPGDDLGVYSASGHSAAIGMCQNQVNQNAIAYCSGQGNTPPFTITYQIHYYNEFRSPAEWEFLGSGSAQFQCVDGWPVSV